VRTLRRNVLLVRVDFNQGLLLYGLVAIALDYA
jgi:hypothetical protein